MNDSILEFNSSFKLTFEQEEAPIEILNLFRPINIFATLILSVFGLFGHFITILIYSKTKYRTNSSHVYLLSLAIIDGLFLIVHLLEDTLRTWQDTFVHETEQDIIDLSYLKQKISVMIISFVNITDRYNIACRLVNFLRYVLRFISAYIIVAFTLQRLSIITSPINNKFKTLKSAWLTVISICLISLIVNLWVPFFFEINSKEKSSYCDVHTNLEQTYFYITLVYIGCIMLVPILVIFISNLLIISFSFKAYNGNNFTIDQTTRSYQTFNTIISKEEKRKNYSSKITRILLVISFSYAILNLPYFVTWCMFFLRKNDGYFKNHFFAALQVSEIFYILNYCVYFYINFGSGSLFRSQVYSICEFIFYYMSIHNLILIFFSFK